MFKKEVYIRRKEGLFSKISSGIVLLPGNTEVAYNYRANTYKFRQDSNFLYFIGIDRPDLFAVIDIDEQNTILFGNEAEIEDEIWTGPVKSLSQLAKDLGIDTVKPLNDLSKYLHKAIKSRAIHFVPMYRHDIMISLAQVLGISPENINHQVSDELVKAIIALRSIKEKEEIAEIESMIEVAYDMHVAAMQMAKPGITEKQIAAAVEAECLKKAYNVSFNIICSTHGEILHNIGYSNILEQGKLLLTDAGAESMRHYASDITRVTPVGGKFNVRQKQVYEIVLGANLAAIKMAKPGILYKDVHLRAAAEIAEGLKQLNLMKGDVDEIVCKGAHALFFPHGLGHMLGLDVHDMEGLGEDNVGYSADIRRSEQFGLAYLRFARKLEQGHVLTVEPGVYFIPGLIALWSRENKFKEHINYSEVEKYLDFGGVRIEDNIIITNNGAQVLGKAIPKTISEVENICNSI